jgi:hypothetical protein
MQIINWLLNNLVLVTAIQQGAFSVLSAVFQFAGWQAASKVCGTLCTLDIGRILRFFAGKAETKRALLTSTGLLALLTFGCMGHLEESKGKFSLAALKTLSSSYRCAQLSDRQATWGAVTAGTAFLAGGTGLPSIWIDNATAKGALIITAVGVGTFGAVSARVTQSTATTWATECSQ